MARVFVSFVGERDPRHDQFDGPALTILEHLSGLEELPDSVLLVYVPAGPRPVALQGGEQAHYFQQGHDANAGDTQRAVVDRFPEAEVTTVALDASPVDADALAVALHDELSQRVDREADKVHLNLSSGTPQMSSAIAILVGSGLVPDPVVWQALDPRHYVDEFGHLLPVQRVIRSDFAVSDEARLSRLHKSLLRCDLKGCLRAVRDLGSSPFEARRIRASVLKQVLTALVRWDEASFGSAKQELQHASERPEFIDADDLREMFEKQCAVLTELDASVKGRGPETQDLLLDLYGSIVRRHVAGDWFSVVNRGARLYEGILNWLISLAGHNARAFDLTRFDNKFKEQFEATWRRIFPTRQFGLPRGGYLDITARTTLAVLLGERGELQGVTTDHVLDLMRLDTPLRPARNHSYEIHGFGPVGKIESQAVVNAAKSMLEVVALDVDDQTLALGPVQLRKLSDLLRTWL